MSERGFLVGLIMFLYIITPTQAQAPAGEEYIVQAGDWLTKIADKYYGNPQDYTLIIEATNAKATESDAFVVITNPDLIDVGQKIWVPLKQSVGIINVAGIAFEAAPIEDLGVQAVVPSVWPRVEDDPFSKYTWRSGPFSFVSFSTTPGNDAQSGVANLLGVQREDLASDILGGELSERPVGGRTWVLYTRDDGGIASVAGATVQDKVIYQINLFSVNTQTETLLNTILENFEISNPTLVQQSLTIENPTPSMYLTNPFELRGTTTQYPFRGRLIYRVLDVDGNQVGRSPFEVVGRLGNPATFAVAGLYEVQTGGPGTVEVAEVSTSDGAIIAIESVGVELVADPDGYTITIDDPLPFASISSPVQVRGKTSDRPFESRLSYRIVDATGQEISGGFLQASGPSGQVNLFDGFAEFEVSENGPGRVEVFDIRPADGAVLTISSVNVWLTMP